MGGTIPPLNERVWAVVAALRMATTTMLVVRLPILRLGRPMEVIWGEVAAHRV
jgi:hypothetical protein